MSTDTAFLRSCVFSSTTAILVLSSAAVALRLWTRKRFKQGIRADDWFMGAALACSLILAVAQYQGLANGLGSHAVDANGGEMGKFLVAVFVHRVGYAPSMFCLKVSIVLFYMRIFPTRLCRRMCITVLVYTLCWALASFWSNLLQCQPLAFFFDKTLGGTCLNIKDIGMGDGATSFAEDVFILAMPLRMILSLKMDTTRRIALAGVLLLGSFICAASILRIMALTEIDTADLTFTYVYPAIWTYVEVGVGIICACLPIIGSHCGQILGAAIAHPTDDASPSESGSASRNSKTTFSEQRSRMGSRINSLVPGAKPEKRGFAKMWEKKAQDIGVDDSTSRVGSLVSHSRTIDPNYDIELQGNNWLAVPASLEGIVVRTEVQHRVEATRRPIKATSHTQRVIQNQLNGRAGSDPGPEIHNGIMTVIEREDGFQFEPT